MSSLRVKPATRNQVLRAQKLHRREQRQRYGQMLVEGPQGVREILTYAPDLVRDLYATDAAFERYPEIRSLAIKTGAWTHFLEERDFRDLSLDAQGLVIVADVPEAISASDALKGQDLVVATVATADPGNLGTIIRTSDAGGAGAVLVGKDSVDVYSPKVVRSTAGSLFHIPVVTGLSFEAIVAEGRAAGFQVLAADSSGEWDLRALMASAAAHKLMGEKVDGPDLTRPVLWVMGNEAHGFDGQALSLVDATVALPMFGKAESLNLSIAAALCTYVTTMSR